MAIVFIKQMDIGRTVSHLDENYHPYLWEEGNYSCDCNRELFYCRAIGVKKDLDSVECGHGRYRIWVVENGEKIYDELGM